MATNGDIGSFEWLFAKRLQLLEAQGTPADDIDSLKARGRQISQALGEFRAQRRTLGDSGKYTREGLRDELAKLAATAAGEIRRSQDKPRQNIVYAGAELIRPYLSA
jgi:hypothetical protein